jgi:hypothetical protein
LLRERENREKVKKFSVNSPKFAMAMRAFLLIIVIIASLSFIVANFSDVCTISKLLSNPPLSWFGNGDVCSETFVDITCDGSGRVTGIDLKNQGLSGTLTPFISNLTALRSLELQGNKLVGNVPLLMGMDSLNVLSLDDNNFTSLPDDFLHGPTSLTQLSINNLPLEPWLIPDNITDCIVLQMFSTVNACVSGSIPDFLANLHLLKSLSLPYNYLTGMPSQLGELSALEVLELDHQKQARP